MICLTLSIGGLKHITNIFKMFWQFQRLCFHVWMLKTLEKFTDWSWLQMQAGYRIKIFLPDICFMFMCLDHTLSGGKCHSYYNTKHLDCIYNMRWHRVIAVLHCDSSPSLKHLETVTDWNYILQLPQLLLLCGEVPADDRWAADSRLHVRTDLSDD